MPSSLMPTPQVLLLVLRRNSSSVTVRSSSSADLEAKEALAERLPLAADLRPRKPA